MTRTQTKEINIDTSLDGFIRSQRVKIEEGSSFNKHPRGATMIDTTKAHPLVVDRETWQAARNSLLGLEKVETRLRDAVAASRRRLPMTEVADYTFQGENGPVTFMDLFANRSQLIVHHFMFDPSWEQGCAFCSDDADNAVPDLAHFQPYDISFVRISRVPIGKLLAYSKRMGWSLPCFSAYECTFNQDWGWTTQGGEVSGFSVYLHMEGKPYLTYQTKARGVEPMSSIAGHLDITPYGRQEKWQEVPPGWPQDDTFTKLRRHDEYEQESK
jgi:predicted dithiol-disulfide oxidoreductase (DUF899 family)